MTDREFEAADRKFQKRICALRQHELALMVDLDRVRSKIRKAYGKRINALKNQQLLVLKEKARRLLKEDYW